MDTEHSITSPQAANGDHLIHEQSTSLPGTFETLGSCDDTAQPHLAAPTPVDDNASSNHDNTDTSYQRNDLSSTSSPSDRLQMASKLIHLTLIMDKVAASEVPIQSSFSYFIKEVDSPFLSPFDHLNWTRIVNHIADLGIQETSVARSILAVQALHRAQADRLPLSHALLLYQAALTNFEVVLGSNKVEFHIVLIVAFLLCLFKLTLPNEDNTSFDELNDVFATRLEAFFRGGRLSPVPLRLCAWLQLLDTASKRGGSLSLLPKPVLDILYEHITEVPDLSALDHDTHPENSLYDLNSAPIFIFYLQLQKISNQAADVSHYRRSRITPEDQAEASDILAGLTAEMYSMWETRPGPLRLKPDELRAHLGAAIAEPLITLNGICLAAYFSEFIEIGRNLGDPLFASPEAKYAMKQVRDIVEGDWNVLAENSLNPGYLRPLVLYGVESFEEDETQWAVNCLRWIKNPITRSSFFASFLESHGESQRSQRRRVTSKYFCYQTFGVPLPFM
jgi:hypothetical protein